jgi:hypothetical protein
VELIKAAGETMVLKVQPIPELIELSVRPGKDGAAIDVQEDVVRGGTLKRSGSMRYKKPVSCVINLCFVFVSLPLFFLHNFLSSSNKFSIFIIV